MALFQNQNESRTRLQQEIAAELQAKAKKRAEDAERPDHVNDSRYIENTKRTTSLAWVWLAIFIAVAVVIIILIVRSAH